MKNAVFSDKKASSYFTGDTLRLRYRNHPVFTAVTMKNVVLWDIKPQFVPHRRHVSATELSELMLCKI
jgi:hypothetical protein